MDYQKIIDRYYPAGSALRDIYMHHCRQVADLALDIARERHLDVDLDQVEAAAMLHDIGIFLTDAPGIHCHGTEPYIKHGLLGSQLLQRDGVDEAIAAVARRHTGAGITNDEIRELSLPLPPGDYMPETLLERLVCYADKFYSKSGDMQRKSLERVRHSMSRHGGDTAARFEQLHREFTD
ncbi:MAG: HD domain-containing protein [Muribaculaceae bacterium]|nr:HD domain-containing protein [Muribaculaceae bacterium]